MKILSIDQSTTKTGWSIFVDGIYSCHGLLNLAKNKDSKNRFGEMVLAICDLIEVNLPDIVVYEDVSVQLNSKVVIQLARLQGAILCCLLKLGIEGFILPPTTWRKILGIKQGARKSVDLKIDAQNYVQDKLGITGIGTDEADAICINFAFHMKEKKGD